MPARAKAGAYQGGANEAQGQAYKYQRYRLQHGMAWPPLFQRSQDAPDLGPDKMDAAIGLEIPQRVDQNVFDKQVGAGGNNQRDVNHGNDAHGGKEGPRNDPEASAGRTRHALAGQPKCQSTGQCAEAKNALVPAEQSRASNQCGRHRQGLQFSGGCKTLQWNCGGDQQRRCGNHGIP